MRIAERMAERENTWRELDMLLYRLDGRRAGSNRRRRRKPDAVWIAEDTETAAPGVVPRGAGGLGADEVLRLGELYRSACADLMLAEAYDMPRETVDYLHALVGRAHNALYRSRSFQFKTWAGELFGSVPRRLRRDPYLRVAAGLFYGTFLIFTLLAAGRPDFAESVVTAEQLEQLDEMYSKPLGAQRNDAVMAGFYIFNNAGIGLKCYGYGLVFAVGTVYVLMQNAMMIGGMFGYMIRSPNAVNFFTFVTAHAPFELTAVVFSAAAGLRLGMGMIVTGGLGRLASVRRAAVQTLPTACAAVFLFVLAAFLEGFVSASALPYWSKASIALACAAILVVYLTLGGRSAGAASAD